MRNSGITKKQFFSFIFNSFMKKSNEVHKDRYFYSTNHIFLMLMLNLPNLWNSTGIMLYNGAAATEPCAS